MIEFSGESSGLSPSGVSPTCDGENKYVTGKARLALSYLMIKHSYLLIGL